MKINVLRKDMIEVQSGDSSLPVREVKDIGSLRGMVITEMETGEWYVYYRKEMWEDYGIIIPPVFYTNDDRLTFVLAWREANPDYELLGTFEEVVKEFIDD